MGLLHSWRDSLLLLTPHFALTTFKSMVETYKVLVRVWYLWLVPSVLVISPIFSLSSNEWYNILYEVVLLMIAVLVTMIVCLAVKPSTSQKNLHYFARYTWFGVMLAPLALLFWQLSFWSHWLIVKGFISRNAIYFHPLYWYMRWLVFNGYFHTDQIASLLQSFLQNIPGNMLLSECIFDIFVLADFLPVWIFFILFFLDSDGSIKQLWYSMVRAVKMMIYNLPLLLLLMVVALLPNFIMSRFLDYHPLVAVAFYILLLKPFLINIWTNVYVKNV